ncbi:hypothetical protein [Poseidonocella sedimentorum]|uniref:Uncharacterized protein n=1 Tax=Poseidonocella sedimentorum TaxID=871652 RepID=A0A1I6DUA8_9RHOB|nr:hypothetical protein [Poseidonocella sedimentorum]SFR09043.1 hypothetical protein SAMN04515673_105172 [Poseidonocella sedimentorum]
MKALTLAVLTLLIHTTAARAAYFEHGAWATVKIGHICHVYSLRSSRETSGALVFSFPERGYDASFEYRYAPYPGEVDDPWGPNDPVVIFVDGEESWIGEEMSTGWDSRGDFASLTTGFVPDMMSMVRGATGIVEVALDRVELGERWIYGQFSAEGFTATVVKAGEWCLFDPDNLPSW